jgi:hypothetical protein
MHVGGIFCDLARALDCVNHDTVPATLHFYGIIRVGANWFSSYSANRKDATKSSNKTWDISLAGVL